MLTRIESLDNLRGFLVLCVSIYHYLSIFHQDYVQSFSGGFLAVEVFIVLSGYLITRVLIKENSFNFLIKRFLRIYPSLVFMITIVLFIVYMNNFEPLSLAFKESVYALLSFYNYFLIFSDIPYFDRFEKEVVFLPLWSLSMEFQFYALSFLLFLYLPRRYIPYAYMFLTFVSMASSFYYFQVQNLNPDHVYFRTEARAHAFFMGGLLALYEDKIVHIFQKVKRLTIPIFLITTFLISLTFFKFSIYTDWFFPFGFLIVDILSLLLIYSLILLSYSFKPLYLLGRISYPIFLWHYPIMLLTKYSSTALLCAECIMFLAILSVSIITHILIEEPFRKQENLKYASTKISLGVFSIFTLYFHNIKSENLEEKVGRNIEKIEQRPAEFTKAIKDTEVSHALIYEPKERECSAFLIGDSVMKGAAPFLVRKYDGLFIDARVNRWFSEALEVAKRRADTIRRCEVVVVHLGHNGYPRRGFVENFIDALRQIGAKEIYFINIKASILKWENSYNNLLKDLEMKGKIRLIDWYSIAKEEYLHTDGIHLNIKGSKVYTTLIGKSLNLTEAEKPTKSMLVEYKDQTNIQKKAHQNVDLEIEKTKDTQQVDYKEGEKEGEREELQRDMEE